MIEESYWKETIGWMKRGRGHPAKTEGARVPSEGGGGLSVSSPLCRTGVETTFCMSAAACIAGIRGWIMHAATPIMSTHVTIRSSSACSEAKQHRGMRTSPLHMARHCHGGRNGPQRDFNRCEMRMWRVTLPGRGSADAFTLRTIGLEDHVSR